MPLERAVVVRGSLSGSSTAKDRRTVEGQYGGREMGLDIPGLEAQLGLTDAPVNVSSDRSATGRRLGQSRFKLGEQLLKCDLVRSQKRIHVRSSFEDVKQLRRGGMSWRQMCAQHDRWIELA